MYAESKSRTYTLEFRIYSTVRFYATLAPNRQFYAKIESYYKTSQLLMEEKVEESHPEVT